MRSVCPGQRIPGNGTARRELPAVSHPGTASSASQNCPYADVHSSFDLTRDPGALRRFGKFAAVLSANQAAAQPIRGGAFFALSGAED